MVKDKYMSPLNYGGHVLGGGLGFSEYKETYSSRNSFAYNMGNLKNSTVHKNSLNLNQFAYNSYQVWKVDNKNKLDYFLGFSIKFNLDIRNNNAKRLGSYNSALSLSFTGAAHFKNNPEDSWSHETAVSIPIFSWAIRPRYASPFYLRPGSNFNKPNHLILTIPKYFGLDLRLGSIWRLENGNALRMEYQGAYQQILPIHPIRVLSHGVNASTLMLLN